MNTKQIEAHEQAGEQTVVLHCKRCWKWRGHYRRVSGGMEIYKCKKCGSEQSYKLPDVEAEDA